MPRLVGHVTALQTFPIKSCKGFKLDTAWCSFEGLEHDRRWAIVEDETGQAMSMKCHNTMSLIKPSINNDGLHLEAPGMDPITITLPLTSQQIKEIKVGGGTSGKGKWAGPEAAAWTSKFLNFKCSIYEVTDSRFLKGHKYGALAQDQDKTGFASFAPVLMCTTEALSELNKDNSQSPYCMDRFRSSIVISNTKLFDEDNWKNLYIGDQSVQLRFLRRCGRCIITHVDPETGEKEDNGPMKILQKSRLPLPENRKREGYSPIFGIYFAVDKEGYIRVGDPVYECSEN